MFTESSTTFATFKFVFAKRWDFLIPILRRRRLKWMEGVGGDQDEIFSWLTSQVSPGCAGDNLPSSGRLRVLHCGLSTFLPPQSSSRHCTILYQFALGSPTRRKSKCSQNNSRPNHSIRLWSKSGGKKKNINAPNINFFSSLKKRSWIFKKKLF